MKDTAIRKRDVFFWGSIVGLLLLQSMGLDFGLPGQYHPDEYFVNINTFKLFHEIKEMTFMPNRYDLGIRWIYFASYIVLFLVGTCLGIFHSFAQFYDSYFAFGNPYIDAASPLFYIMPRAISFCFYGGCIVVVFVIMKRLCDTKTASFVSKIAVLAAVLLPAGYLYSHYGTRESALAFFTLILILHSLFYFSPQKLKSSVVAGILLGVSTGIKENTAIFLFLYLFFLTCSWLKKEIAVKKYFAACFVLSALMVAVFFILNPQRIMVDNIGETARILGGGGETAFLVDKVTTHFVYPLAFMREFSLPLVVLLLTGTILAWFKNKNLRPLIVVLVASYLVLDFVNANGYNKADRFIMNLFLPFLIVGIYGLTSLLQDKSKVKYLVVIPLIIGIFNAHELASIYAVFNGQDTRDLAKTWIHKNIPEKSIVAKETIFTPSIDEKKYNVIRNDWALGNYTLDSLKKENVEYLVISEKYRYGWAHNDIVKRNYDSFLPFTIKTFESEFKPQMNNFHSPTIWICKIR